MDCSSSLIAFRHRCLSVLDIASSYDCGTSNASVMRATASDTRHPLEMNLNFFIEISDMVVHYISVLTPFADDGFLTRLTERSHHCHRVRCNYTQPKAHWVLVPVCFIMLFRIGLSIFALNGAFTTTFSG